MVDRLRRNLLIGVPAALALRPFAAAAQAPLRIEITEGVVEPMPFARPPSCRTRPAAADLAAQITQVVVADLTGTGLFREMPAEAHIGKVIELRRAGAVRRLEGDQRPGADHRRGRGQRRQGAGAVPALGRLRPGAARRGAAVRRRHAELAAAGAQGRRRRSMRG